MKITSTSTPSSICILLLFLLATTLVHGSTSPAQQQQRWHHATRMAALEQDVEDYNAEYIASSTTAAEACRHRRLLCLPLDTDLFNPSPGVFSHDHVQNGDKMSIPLCFQSAIVLNNGQVPWLFRVRRIKDVTGERVEFVKNTEDITEHVPLQKELDSVVGGPIDFRAPSCYIFVPLWMMRGLGLRPLDIVEVDFIDTIPRGSMVKLRPHRKSFAETISNPQAVLETELRHYSSLTAGTTIAMEYNGEEYWFDVVELRSEPKGEKVPMIKMQDCDVSTDFLPSREQQLEQRLKRRQKLMEQRSEK